MTRSATRSDGDHKCSHLTHLFVDFQVVVMPGCGGGCVKARIFMFVCHEKLQREEEEREKLGDWCGSTSAHKMIERFA